MTMSKLWTIDLDKLADMTVEKIKIEVKQGGERVPEAEKEAKENLRDFIINEIDKENLLENISFDIAKEISKKGGRL